MKDDAKFQELAKDVIRDLAEKGVGSDFVPKVKPDGEVETSGEWQERVFGTKDIFRVLDESPDD